MRLIQVAKALGMTGQELRRELTEVNLGVKPTDREVPDTLARGVIRYLAQKKGIEVDVAALGEMSVDEEAEKEKESPPPAARVEEPVPVSAPAAPQASAPSKESLPVLSKLSLDDVPRELIAREKRELEKAQKEVQDERRREAKGAVQFKKKEKAPGTASQQQIKKKEGVVMLPAAITVKEFAEKTGIQVPLVVQALMKNGVLATINQTIDYDTAAIVAAELSVQVQREQRSATADELLSRNLRELTKDDPENLSVRAPVVVVMGHVDHGKTAILDAIRETDVVSGEAGGITQHIGAYQVIHSSGKEITFLDTPGHEAFTAMRARGAQVGDIAVLVVSAEEGVRPTTIEAIAHAREANVPMIVAINKIDKERADVDRVMGELAGHGLQPEEWGGTVPFVRCSAVTKQGIDDLLEHILLVAELRELKANPNRIAIATVIESHLDPALGSLATVIVNTGTLKIGDPFVCGKSGGKVKAMMDARGKRLEQALPSAAVRIAGLDEPARVGDILQVVSDEREARELAERMRDAAESSAKRGFADLVSRLSEGKLRKLKIILKADAQGSLEAIENALSKLSAPGGVVPKVIHAAVGTVTESDVMMASASQGIVLSFHVPVPPEVLRTAERE